MKRLLETFKRQDEKRLFDDYKYYTDVEKVRANALTAAVELEELFARDVKELDEQVASLIGERRDDRGSNGSARLDE